MYKQKDTKRTWPKCSETHNHDRHFIPIRKLKQADLPKSCSSNTLEEIRLLSTLTVRIIVTKDKLKNCGKKIILSGTGTVVDVVCKSHCKGYSSKLFSTQKLGRVALIRIKTANHVISSDAEAKKSSVDFFYDDADDLKGAKTLRVDNLYTGDVKEDWSVVECITDNMALADVLSESLDRLSRLKLFDTAKERGFAIVVSHPHGMTKHVSFGQWSFRRKSAPGSRKRKLPNVRRVECPVPFPSFESMYIQLMCDTSHDLITYTYIVGFTETFNIFSSMIVNQDGKSEAVGIECEVTFPDGEISMRQIWRFDKPVKDTKLCLMSEGNINFPEEELYLELDLPDGRTQIMEDSKDIEYYWDDLLCANRITMKRR